MSCATEDVPIPTEEIVCNYEGIMQKVKIAGNVYYLHFHFLMRSVKHFCQNCLELGPKAFLDHSMQWWFVFVKFAF